MARGVAAGRRAIAPRRRGSRGGAGTRSPGAPITSGGSSWRVRVPARVPGAMVGGAAAGVGLVGGRGNGLRRPRSLNGLTPR